MKSNAKKNKSKKQMKRWVKRRRVGITLLKNKNGETVVVVAVGVVVRTTREDE